MHSLSAYLRKVKHTDEHTQFPIFLPSCMRVLGLWEEIHKSPERKLKLNPEKATELRLKIKTDDDTVDHFPAVYFSQFLILLTSLY